MKRKWWQCFNGHFPGQPR